MIGSIDLPAGVWRNGTETQARGRWYDANLIRWKDGRMRAVGGWTRITTTPFTGKARALLAWGDNSNDRRIAIATPSKLYESLSGAATLTDITPAGFVAGSDDPVESVGYGGGAYGAGAYGTRRAGGTFTPPTTWTLDNWGQNLVACSTTDGKIYEYDLDGLPAVAVANAPTDNQAIVVSDDRHLIALGANGNQRLVKWSAREDNTTWTPSDTNEAGDFELQTDGIILGGARTRGQVLIITTADAHRMIFIGQPFIFSRERVGAACGAYSSASILTTGDGGVFWMGPGGFWTFDGAIVRPVPCEVADYIYSDIATNLNTRKVTGGHNSQFGELWWFYPSAGATENDRYVIYNYREDHWSIGQLARTAFASGEVFGFPFATGTDNHLYRHEDGRTDNGSPMYSSVYARSGAVELEEGERTMIITQLMPDERTRGEVEMTFRTRFTPNGAETTYGPYAVRDDGYTDTRLSGRQFAVEVRPVGDTDWRLGKVRVKIAAKGKR